MEGESSSARTTLSDLTNAGTINRKSKKRSIAMSLTDGLPHLFRKRTLMRRLELIGLDLDEEDAAILARQESLNPELNEGSVLFEDEDADFRTNRDVVLGQSGYSSLDQSLLNDSIDITRATSRRTLYPAEPGLPKEVKEHKWLRVFASCIVISR